MRDMSQVRWTKSSYSQGGRPECVEVTEDLPGQVGVRDSKNTHAGVHAVSRPTFKKFITGLKRGNFS